MSVELSEQLINEMAIGSTLLDGRKLVQKGAFSDLSKTADGTLIFAKCKGSGSSPYEVAMDLARGSDRPTLICNCPSRQYPCKHAVGLMVAFLEKGSQFKVKEAPDDLLAKRVKSLKRQEKASAKPDVVKETKPRTVNKAALAKKAEQQKAALDTLETFILDLVSTGLGGLNERNIKAIQDQARRMGDADLPGARALLLRLATLSAEAPAKGKAKKPRTVTTPISEELRHAQLTAIITQLWATLRKGQKALENRLEEGESRSEADAYTEMILGRRWQLTELKEAGYWVSNRTLIELAHERYDDDLLEMTITTGYLIDLDDGSIHMERSMIPYQAQRSADVRHRSSRAGVLSVNEAALYPGAILNRRIRWDEKDTQTIDERARNGEDYTRLHAYAKPLKPLLASFREQIKNPLAPQEAVVLVAAVRVGLLADNTPVMVDADGARLAFRDPSQTQYATTANLIHAIGAYGAGSIVVRLWYDLLEQAIFGQALALIVGENHLRLGL
ncbi:MAG: hypothetical protein AB1489_27430 [Acidobacteriota bacterium]